MTSHAKKCKYQEVINVKFIDDWNVLELAYDSLVKGCKSNDHIQKRCDKLYVVPCRKTLQHAYFRNIFTNPSQRSELSILEKQQVYVNSCHRVCKVCLDKLVTENPNRICCPICTRKKDVDFSNHTKYVFDMSISQGFEIDSLMEFHDLFDNFTNFFKQSSKSKKNNLVPPYVVFQSTFVQKGYFELLVLQKFKIQE